MELAIESSISEIQIRFYTIDGDKKDYKSSMPVKIFGPRAVLTSLSLEGLFYKNFDTIFNYINLVCDTNIWHCHVVERHYAVILRKLENKYKVEILANEKNAKRDMLWLEVTKK